MEGGKIIGITTKTIEIANLHLCVALFVEFNNVTATMNICM